MNRSVGVCVLCAIFLVFPVLTELFRSHGLGSGSRQKGSFGESDRASIVSFKPALPSVPSQDSVQGQTPVQGQESETGSNRGSGIEKRNSDSLVDEPVTKLDQETLEAIQKIRKEVGISVFPIESVAGTESTGNLSTEDPFKKRIDAMNSPTRQVQQKNNALSKFPSARQNQKEDVFDFTFNMKKAAVSLESKALENETNANFVKANELRVLANSLRILAIKEEKQLGDLELAVN